MSGANKNWIVTGRTYTASSSITTSTLLNKSTSGAPGQTKSAFSSANYVVRNISTSQPLFTNWTYVSLTTSKWNYCGFVQDSSGIVKSDQTNSPAQCYQVYPTTYLSTWSWTSTVTSTTYKGGSGVGVTLSMGGLDLVDGYGTITTPAGSFPCLRIKRKSIINFGFFSVVSYSYDFVDQNGTIATISVNSTGSIPSSVTYYAQTVTGISEYSNFVPNSFQLFQNYPNPFNPGTTIQYSIPNASFVELKVFDLLGRELCVLVNKKQEAGTYQVQFDGQNLPAGLYFYRLQTGEFCETKKMVIVK